MLAILRDHPSRKFHFFYSVLALGWTGTPGQKRVLERAIATMAIMVIPIAVSLSSEVNCGSGSPTTSIFPKRKISKINRTLFDIHFHLAIIPNTSGEFKRVL